MVVMTIRILASLIFWLDTAGYITKPPQRDKQVWYCQRQTGAPSSSPLSWKRTFTYQPV